MRWVAPWIVLLQNLRIWNLYHDARMDLIDGGCGLFSNPVHTGNPILDISAETQGYDRAEQKKVLVTFLDGTKGILALAVSIRRNPAVTCSIRTYDVCVPLKARFVCGTLSIRQRMQAN